MITPEMLIVLGILCCTIFLLITNLVRGDLTALLVVTALMASGVVTVPEALSGFANPVVHIVAFMFVVSEAMVHTGIAQRMGEWIISQGGSSELKLMTLLMVVAGGVGAFMSSTATAAIFIPVTIAVAEKAGLNHKRLLMPLAAAALISGMMTLVATSPNIVVNDVLRGKGFEVLPFFSFTPFGILTLVLALGFMAVCGRRLLSREKHLRVDKRGKTIRDLIGPYGLDQRSYLVRVLVGSPLVDRSVARVKLRETYNVNLAAIQTTVNGRNEVFPIRPGTVFQSNDLMVIIGTPGDVEIMVADLLLQKLHLPAEPAIRKAFFQVIGVAEIMLPPESDLIGKTLKETQFQSRFHFLVLGIRRKTEVHTLNINEQELQFGDVLLVCGAWDDILQLRSHRDDYLLLSLPEDYREVVPARRKAPLVLGLLGTMVGLLVFNIVPTVTAVLMTSIALVLTRCVPPESCYKLVDWSTVILIAGILPLSLALEKTGVSDILSGYLLQVVKGSGPMVLFAVLFLLTSVVGLFLSNTPTAIFIAPMAVDAGIALGVSPQACAMVVAIACSSAFISPIGSPVNMIVRNPGGYALKDYLKVGFPMWLLAMVGTVFLAWVLYVF